MSSLFLPVFITFPVLSLSLPLLRVSLRSPLCFYSLSFLRVGFGSSASLSSLFCVLDSQQTHPLLSLERWEQRERANREEEQARRAALGKGQALQDLLSCTSCRSVRTSTQKLGQPAPKRAVFSLGLFDKGESAEVSHGARLLRLDAAIETRLERGVGGHLALGAVETTSAGSPLLASSKLGEASSAPSMETWSAAFGKLLSDSRLYARTASHGTVDVQPVSRPLDGVKPMKALFQPTESGFAVLQRETLGESR